MTEQVVVKQKHGEMAETTFSWKQVKSHKSRKDCWVVVRGNVYDVSSFLDQHPGGADMLVKNAGKDCTEDFEAIHSAKAEKQLEKLKIGVVEDNGPEEDEASTIYEPYTLVENIPTNGNGIFLSLQSKTKPQGVKCIPSLAKTLNKFVKKSNHPPEALVSALDVYSTAYASGMHVNIKVDIPGRGVVTRPYTPIEWLEDGFRLLVKVYPPDGNFAGGVVSTYLNYLPVGATVMVSRPTGHILCQVPGGKLTVHGNTVKVPQMAFLCGGSGITPAFQIIRNGLLDPLNKKHFTLLYASTREEDILLRSELDALQESFPDRFTCWYTVSQPPAESANWKFSVGQMDAAMIAKHLPPGEDEKCFVGMCGPPAMISQVCIPGLKKHGYLSDYYASF